MCSNRAVAASDFADVYYQALQASRNTIADYYVVNETLPDGKTVPMITWNGNAMHDAATFQKMFENDMPYTHYDVQSLDCHVLNPSYSAEVNDPEKNVSIVVMASGYVRLEEPREGPMKGFSDTFVLVPNLGSANAKGPQRQRRNWLIQTQTFRYVV